MRIAYFDCLSGISGDMTLGALLDLGVPLDFVVSGLQSMGLPDLRIEASNVKKCGFRATHVQVLHPEQRAHRHLHHIDAMIDQGEAIPLPARELAKRIFLNLGEAEAKVHGSTLAKVHFHEVGAIDSIADIVGAAMGLTWLGVQAVEASPVPTGHGFIEIDHGRVSIPAPATAELLQGIPLAASNVECELTTPTGAAILKTTARAFGPVPAMTIQAIGYGAGTKDLPGQANVLRLLIGETAESPSTYPIEVDRVVVLETNIDSTSGEDLADCVNRLWHAGAIDVYQSPCLMKKGRSGVHLTVLAGASRVPEIERIIFENTLTIGIRHTEVQRHKLIRQSHRLETSLGPVAGKCVWLPSGQWRFTVEYDEAATLAATHGVSVQQVRQLASLAFNQSPPLDPPTAAGVPLG